MRWEILLDTTAPQRDMGKCGSFVRSTRARAREALPWLRHCCGALKGVRWTREDRREPQAGAAVVSVRTLAEVPRVPRTRPGGRCSGVEPYKT